MPQIHRSQIEPDIVLMRICGRITLGRECQTVEWAVEDLIRDNAKRIVFDLSELEYVDSTGIGIIVTCAGKVAAAGGELRLACLHPRVAELMRITKLLQIMSIYPTVAAATDNFAGT